MAKFTAVRLDVTKYRTRKALCSLETMHAIIERALGPVDGRNSSGVRTQWRLDGDTILIVSEGTPDRRTLAEQLNVIEERTVDYAGLLQQIVDGMTVRFRCKVNPTVRAQKRNADKGITTRVPLVHDDEILEWMDRQSRRWGFCILRAGHDGSAPQVFIRKEIDTISKQTGKITLNAAIIDGILRVEDADKFRQAMLTGIGQGKAYGFGLLSIAPVSGSALA